MGRGLRDLKLAASHASQKSSSSSTSTSNMSTSLALKIALALLMVDAEIEQAFIASMVAWLHRRAGRAFDVNYQGSTYSLHGKPAGLLVNHGHADNGAAGTALVAIGFGGILALWLRSRSNFRTSGISKFVYHFWLVMTVLSALLTFSVMISTFVLTAQHAGQAIDQIVASSLDNQPYPNYVAYPLLNWTPENWFDAVLNLDLADAADRSNVQLHVAVMRGWRWNLIPMFILGALVSLLAVWEAMQTRRTSRDSQAYEGLRQKEGSDVI